MKDSYHIILCSDCAITVAVIDEPFWRSLNIIDSKALLVSLSQMIFNLVACLSVVGAGMFVMKCVKSKINKQ